MIDVKIYYQYNRAEFENYLGDILVRLNYHYNYMEDDCINYQEIKNKINDIFNEEPILEKILDNDVLHSLTKDQVGKLMKVINYQDSLRMIEEKRLFFDGGKEAISYLKLVGLIKDTE